MLRKTTLTIAALAALGAAALAPTSASATYYKPWHGGYYGHSFGHSYGHSCYRTRWVKSYYGWRKIRVNVCGYGY